MSTPGSGPDDRPGDEPTPPPWDAPPQPPAWDRPADPYSGVPGAPPGGPQYGAPPAGGPPYGQQPGQPYGAVPYGTPPGAPGWGPPPGYAGYGYPPPQQTDGKAITALVLAIASWVLCPVVPAIIALVLASGSQRDIDASGGRLGGDGLNKATRIVSWIHLGLVGVIVAIVLLVLVFAGAAAFETSTTTYGT